MGVPPKHLRSDHFRIESHGGIPYFKKHPNHHERQLLAGLVPRLRCCQTSSKTWDLFFPIRFSVIGSPRIAPDLPPKNLNIQNPQVIIFPIFPIFRIHPYCGCFRFSMEVLCGRLLAARQDHLGVETDALCVRLQDQALAIRSSKVVENQYFTGVDGRYIMIYHDIS